MAYHIEWHIREVSDDTARFIENNIIPHFTNELTTHKEFVFKHELAKFAKERLGAFSASQNPVHPGDWNVIVGMRYASALSYQDNCYATIEILDKTPNKAHPDGRTVLVFSVFKGSDPLDEVSVESGFVEVSVPAGTGAGDVIEVALADGRKGQFVVPAGAVPGTKFFVPQNSKSFS
eukprot:c7438_g1_i1.p1 GENE.c7438_g1_i1~~c7438_g1_i1.p1  ORF type:complete len:177 (-),score=59.51 c7438_g1_i1:222-752(-)